MNVNHAGDMLWMRRTYEDPTLVDFMPLDADVTSSEIEKCIAQL